MKIICRKSNLSQTQAHLAREVLLQHFPDVSINFIFKETQGDLDQTTALYKMPNKNVFSSDIDVALLKGSADFAVHSLKDVGEERLLSEGAFEAAVFDRDLAYDIVIFKPPILDILKENRPLSIGTSSLRREELVPSFLQKALPFNADFNTEKPVINIKPIRGNVETRLRKLQYTGDYDGIVLAAAGLNRLLKSKFYEEVKTLLEGTLRMWLPLVECPPALGQGALLIECLKTNKQAVQMLKAIDNQALKAQLLAERTATLDFGKGCHQRFGAVFINNPAMSDVGFGKSDSKNNLMDIDSGAFPKSDILNPTSKGFVIANGKTADNQPANRFVFEKDSRLKDKKIVSATDFMREFFDYEFYDSVKTFEIFKNLEGLENTFFVAHHRAATDETLNILRGSKNWASGTKTWFELAKKGIWVEGCADGFGIDFLKRVWQSPLANISEKGLILLTNEDSALDWQQEGRKAIATYRLIPNPSAGLIAALQNAEAIFWTSFKQFEACKSFYTEGVLHACPAGKTGRKLTELGFEPVIFPSIKAFLSISH